VSKQKTLWVVAIAGVFYGLLLTGLSIASPAFLSFFVPIFFLLAAALLPLVLYAERKSTYFDLSEDERLSKCPVGMLATNLVLWTYFAVMLTIGNRTEWDVERFALVGFFLMLIPYTMEACGRMIHARLKSQARNV
jgi:hypothetical protein